MKGQAEKGSNSLPLMLMTSRIFADVCDYGLWRWEEVCKSKEEGPREKDDKKEQARQGFYNDLTWLRRRKGKQSKAEREGECLVW